MQLILCNQIYDSNESIRTAEEVEINQNEISPSDFNVLNQRYEEDFLAIQIQEQMKRQQLALGSYGLIPDQFNYNGQMDGIQSPDGQLLGQQQYLSGGRGNNKQRLPLLLGSSNSNVSIGLPKTTKSGGGKKKSKNKSRSNSRANKSTSGNPIQHLGLMTPTSGNKYRSRGNSFGGLEFGERGFISPKGSSRVGGGVQNLNSNNNHPFNQDLESLNKTNASNMNNNSKIGNQHVGRTSGGSRMGSISPSVPQTDINKLKSLEKIYLQRLEIPGNPSSATKKKKAKHNLQNLANENHDFDSQSAHSYNVNNFNYGDTRKVRDTSDIHAPSHLENPNQLIIADFDNDSSQKE